jgi:hypothetical protein
VHPAERVSSDVAFELMSHGEAADVAEGADPRLCEVAEQLDSYGWAAELPDEHWRLVWISQEMTKMYGADPKQVGVGDHVLVLRGRGVASGAIPFDSAERWLRTNGPFLL